jgi:hypothetical protein
MTTPRDPYRPTAPRQPDGAPPAGQPHPPGRHQQQDDRPYRQDWPEDQAHYQQRPARPQRPHYPPPGMESGPRQSTPRQPPLPGYPAPGYQDPYRQQEPSWPPTQQPGGPTAPGHALSRRRQVPPPKRHRGLLAAAGITVGAIVLAALAFYVLEGQNTGHPAATAATTASCRQQYQSWKTGPARAKAKPLVKALNGLQSAGKSDDINLMRGALRRAGMLAHQLQAYPMPRCADPAGYWAQTLADIRAGGDNAGAATGLVGLIAAEVPLKKVPPLERKLQAELKTTAGVS